MNFRCFLFVFSLFLTLEVKILFNQYSNLVIAVLSYFLASKIIQSSAAVRYIIGIVSFSVFLDGDKLLRFGWQGGVI